MDILLKEAILSFTQNPDFFDINILKTVNSTNSYTKDLAIKGAKHLTVVIADSQTNGRGRLGRDFFSPGGTGIYMSILIDPQKIKIPFSLLTIAAGVAVCRTLNSICKSPALIKWVNDIFVNGKKVCGILAESILESDTPSPACVILGIGINVSTPQDIFPGKLSEIAGSIFPENADRNVIIAKILTELSAIFENSLSESLILEYKEHSLVLSKKISFTQNGKAYIGTATDINIEGNLVVRLDSGKEMVLKSGEVSLGSLNFLKDNL